MSEHGAERDAGGERCPAPCCTACEGRGGDQSGACSDCYGTGHVHPIGEYDTDPDLPALLAEARRTFPPANCRLGPTEHDGSRFCHEHVGRVHAGSPTPWMCARPDVMASEEDQR